MECPVCSYTGSEPLLRCPDCSSLFPTRELEEFHNLKYLQQRLETWKEQGVTSPALVFALEEVRRDLTFLEGRLTAARQRPPELPVAPAPPPIPPPQETRIYRPSSPPEMAAQASASAEAPLTLPVTPPYEARPPREPISWAKIGEALLSRRSLQTFLYLGATLLVLSAIIVVVQLWSDLHWVPRQGILLAGLVALLSSGYFVREKMGLRLSGGVLMDIGALWVPLNVGALLFEFLEVESQATIPGLGIPLGLPMIGWMVIAAVSTPIYALIAHRFRLVLMVYGAAIGAGATLLTGLAALGTPLEWQLAAVIISGPAFLWASRRLHLSQRTELGFHLFWLVQGAIPALLAGVVGLVAADIGGQSAVTTAIWAALLFYGTSFLLYRHLAFEILLVIGLPAGLFTTLSLHVPSVPLDWYNPILVGVAVTYVLVGRYVRRSPLWTRSGDPALKVAGMRVEPFYLVALLLTVAAAIWPVANVPSAFVTLYGLVALYGFAGRIFQRQSFIYLAVVLLFAPFALTIQWVDVSHHWRAMLFAPLAMAYLAAAEIALGRRQERKVSLSGLLSPRGHLRSFYARPLFMAGYAATVVALVLGAIDLFSYAADRNALTFLGAAPAPLTYLLVAGIFGASAYLRRSSLFVHLTVWIFLSSALLLAERGFYAGWTFEGADFFLLLGGLSLAYIGSGLVLDRVRGHYSKAPYLLGYILTVVGMIGTYNVREFNLGMVGMSVVIYAVSAYAVHRGRHLIFQW